MAGKPFAKQRVLLPRKEKLPTTGDILVYSGGPSGRPFREPLGDTSHALTLQYDPTNGLTSAGDLFIRIPRR